MNAWSELPNAKHIDWALESMVSNKDIWIQARNQARDQAINQARNRAINQAREQAWFQARDQAWDQARGQVWGQVWEQAWEQAWGVLLALIAYDDCEKYLCMTYDELKTWAVLSENPQAILLLPMLYVKEKTNE